jgi:hypothetical protein
MAYSDARRGEVAQGHEGREGNPAMAGPKPILARAAKRLAKLDEDQRNLRTGFWQKLKARPNTYGNL